MATLSGSSHKTGVASASAAPEQIWRNWVHLCSKIGERRAGSPGDRAAADFILRQFHAAGLTAVHEEGFPCVSVISSHADIALGVGNRLRKVSARVLAGSPSTKGEKVVETDLVWVEMPEQADRMFQPSLRGKIVVLVGPMPTRADHHRRLVACQPAAVIHVDDRLPFSWVKDDGVYPAWARKYGMPPIATIPYQSAWQFRKEGATRARVRIKVELKNHVAQNLVGDIAGRRPELPLVLIGAHHDTQCHNTGADDNASGVVALLTIAAQLARSRPLRSIRFVSFGAEEQLSVGSAFYAGAHRLEMKSFGVVLNLDSVASPLGHHWLMRGGTEQFGTWLRKRLAKYGLDSVEKGYAMPFADHFPFAAFGVPAVTLMRPNMDSGMRWQHHSAHDNLKNVSVTELQRVARAVGGVALELARASNWPFGRGPSPEQQAETNRMARELFGFRNTT